MNTEEKISILKKELGELIDIDSSAMENEEAEALDKRKENIILRIVCLENEDMLI